MRVSVFGLGYVGSVTSACLAQAGHETLGVDVNREKVAMVNQGAPPLVEEGLGELLADAVSRKRLRATVSVDEAVAATDLALICVGILFLLQNLGVMFLMQNLHVALCQLGRVSAHVLQ